MIQRILDLTLEIIYLLTGEAYIVMKKTNGRVAENSSILGSEGVNGTQKFNIEPPYLSTIHDRKRDMKILELTYKIIDLLTGEVSVRCEDIAIYFTLEEWEYLEGHKDLYKNVIMTPKSHGGREGRLTLGHFLAPKSSSDVGSKAESFLKPKKGAELLKTHKQRKNASKYITEPAEQPLCNADAELPDVYIHKKCAQMKYAFYDIKEQSSSDQGGNAIRTDVDTLKRKETEYASAFEESTTYQEDRAIGTDILIPLKHTHAGYVSSPAVEQPATQEAYCFEVDTYIPAEATPIENMSLYNKSELTLGKERNLTRACSFLPTERVQIAATPYSKRKEKFSSHKNHLESGNSVIYNIQSTAHDEMYTDVDIFPNQKEQDGYGNSRMHRKSNLPVPRSYVSDKLFHKNCVSSPSSLTESVYSCVQCQKHFTAHAELVGHQRTHDRERVSCSECGGHFASNLLFVTPMTLHKGNRPHSCAECQTHYKKKSHLDRHIRTHTGDKPFVCAECGKSSFSNEDRVSHQRTHVRAKPFVCSECGKSFSLHGNLIRHQRLHTGEKQFVCSECGKCFSRGENLIRHQITHTGGKRFECLECGKCFKYNSSLVQHQTIHTGLKRFKCADCGKCFSQNGNLIRHQRTHTGERPFSCSDCGKCFSLKAVLNKHKRIHTGEKPYPCTVCARYFRRRSHVKSHMKVHMRRNTTELVH